VIQILDSTLREGEQTPGVYFDGHIKLAIAELLDDIGIDIIEAGHPMVTPEIFEAIRQISNHNLKAKIGAHSRSLESDINMALECGVDFLGIFYCVSDERLNHVFKRELNSAIDQIAGVIEFAKRINPQLEIRYTPEDTVRSNFKNVTDVAIASVRAGADIISIADTTGFMIPGTENNMYDYISRLKDTFNQHNISPKIAVHCHNDRGLALANAIDAIRAGAEIIDVSVLGLGERAGIVDMAQLLILMQSNLDEKPKWNLQRLPELYNLVSKYAGIPIPAHFPIIGNNAFTHCAGVHTHAALKDPGHYQSLDPSIVGRKMEVSLDHMSGLSSVQWAIDKLEIEVDQELLYKILDIIKSIGQKGRTVDLTELVHIIDWCKKHPALEKLYI
jgi:2-isopropylmalate synthase